jgi:hypothetical protein
MLVEGECHCGEVYPIGEYPHTCVHHVVCAWGVIEHPRARPDLGEVGPLTLVTATFIDELLRDGPVLWHRGPCDRTTCRWERNSATERAGRLFFHSDYADQRWTWELFDTHWADGRRAAKLYIGRWPD